MEHGDMEFIASEGKYFTYELIERINRNSWEQGRNQNMTAYTIKWDDQGFLRNQISDNSEVTLPEIPRLVDRSERYPILQAFVHNGEEIRAVVVLTRHGDCGILDMSFDEYKSLPVSPNLIRETE